MVEVYPTTTRGHNRLDDDATENVKPHFCGFTGICHCTGVEGMELYGIQRVKVRCYPAILRAAYLIPQTY